MTPITLELPDDLAQQLQQFDTETLSDLLRQFLRLYHPQLDSPDDAEAELVILPPNPADDDFVLVPPRARSRGFSRT